MLYAYTRVHNERLFNANVILHATLFDTMKASVPYSDVTKAPWRLKSPAFRRVVQQHVKANVTENMIVPHD